MGVVCVCVSKPVSKATHIVQLCQIERQKRGRGAEMMQGGSGPFSSHCLTKTLLIGCDMTLGRQSHVPAAFIQFWLNNTVQADLLTFPLRAGPFQVEVPAL